MLTKIITQDGKEHIIRIKDQKIYDEFLKTEMCNELGINYCSIKGNKKMCPKTCGLYKK